MSSNPFRQDDVPNATAANQQAQVGPLVWRPWIRALGWLSSFFYVAICAAVVWEVIDRAELHLGLVFVRAAWIWLAALLCAGLLLVFDLWVQVLGHTYANYSGRLVAAICALATLVFLVVTAAYLWTVRWPLQLAWTFFEPIGLAIVRSGSGSSFEWPPWLSWLVLPPLLAFAVRTVMFETRYVVRQIADGIGLLGFWRAVRGALLMFVLRHRLPRRDLFMLSPIFSPMPFVALAAFLFTVIEITIIKWTLPPLVLLWAVLHGIGLLAPPLWLYLGQSDFDSFASFYSLRAAWRKNGLTLLNRLGCDGARFYAAWRKTLRLGSLFYDPSVPRAWSLRTRDDMWESTVLLLMDFVPVVIVDVRGESDIVREELEWLQDRGRKAKAWYIAAGDDEVAPAERVAVSRRYPLVEDTRLVTVTMLASGGWARTGISVPPARPPAEVPLTNSLDRK
jgi:hypothetical protein